MIVKTSIEVLRVSFLEEISKLEEVTKLYHDCLMKMLNKLKVRCPNRFGYIVLHCFYFTKPRLVFRAEVVPDMTACDILMGKWPLMPKILPLKKLEAPLTSATLARVPAKNCPLHSETSTFTKAVVITNTSRITASDNRIRMLEEILETSTNNQSKWIHIKTSVSSLNTMIIKTLYLMWFVQIC